MFNRNLNNLTYLKLLEASQSLFESSEKALKAVEDALTATKMANVEAKIALYAATKAFKAANYKTSENERTSTSYILSADVDLEPDNADPD